MPDVIMSVREKYNELLTSFGTKSKNWAKGKEGKFLEKIITFYLSKSSGSLFHDRIPPGIAFVLEHEINLKLCPSKKLFAMWLSVKKSKIRKKIRSGKKQQRVPK